MVYRVMNQKSLNLCFFWHMHQPDYRGSDGVMKMPWVFLHAIKDYYEMPWLVSMCPGFKATFNITAPLIEQLNLYSDPLRNDYFLSLLKPHPSQLDDPSRKWLIKICKSTQYETMVMPLVRYSVLYQKNILSDEELIELETLFLLAWCGNFLRQENQLVKRLIQRGSGFTQAEKTELLYALCDFVATILPFYADLQNAGVISISTTPYNHPILPLLIDIENAKHANNHTVLPDNPISLKADAIEQVERSIELYEKTFGKKPTGFWPAEGAVDKASISIYREHNLHWIATDESILFQSLENDDRSTLYETYIFDGVTIGFRDHGLSDLIGFTYRFKSAYDATVHFIQSLEQIAKKQDNPTVFAILDGENAWEFFENNGYDFLTTLYKNLAQTPWCKTLTMDEMSKQENSKKLDKLAPGSWINGNFNTWCGNQEKNRAWELIYQTRRDVDNFSGVISADVAQKIKYHFLASECSDWFWWYGDDHTTEFAYEFDALFREHLITIYRLLDLQSPLDLYEPIMTHKSSASFLIKPQSNISPVIDGNYNSFFDWQGSGSIDERKIYSTMDRVRGPVDIVYYGCDSESVYLAFEGDIISLDKSSTLHIVIEETGKKLIFPLDKPCSHEGDKLALGERLECALSREHFKKYTSVHLRIDIVHENKIIQSMPGFGSLFVDFAETRADNWFI